MTMDDIDVRVVLQRATDHLTDPPGLLDDVRRGGHRRVARRRTVLAAGLAGVAASVGGAVGLSGTSGSAEVASPLFDQPSRGDLAGDEAYLRRLLAVWRRHMESIDFELRGEPHVVWAGSTPAGPAAYIIQRTADNPVVSEPAGDRMVAVAAFVEPTARGPRVMTVETVTDAGQDGNSQAALLGAGRDVLLVLDTARSVEFSPELRYAADGRVERTFHPVAFRNGAAVLPVPPQRTKVTVGLARTPVHQENLIHISNTSEILFPGGRDRPAPPLYRHTLAGAERLWGADPRAVVQRYVFEEDVLAEYVDQAGVHTHNGSPLLTIYGATPDGRRLLLLTLQYDDDPARVIALLGRGDAPFRVVASAFADWNAALPVRLRLPDRQGTLIAAEGAALSYRTHGGRWQDARRDAALLPATATEVRVTRGNGAATTVPLAP
jgi:hypothetical protein